MQQKIRHEQYDKYIKQILKMKDCHMIFFKQQDKQLKEEMP